MKLKSSNKVDTTFSMSSMTDIVFLLLIFFLLTTNVPYALDLVLPKAKGKSMKAQNVSVSIDAHNNLFINDKQVSSSLFERELSIVLKNMANPTIILRAEETVQINKVVHIMDIANKNNYKVILAVRPQ